MCIFVYVSCELCAHACVICTCKILPWYPGIAFQRNVNNTWQKKVLGKRNLHFILNAFSELFFPQRCDLSKPEKRESILATENREHITPMRVFIKKGVLCVWVCTCLRNLWVAAFARTLLLSKVCVSLRRLCSSSLMPYWPQIAKAFPQAEFIFGTRTTSSHTCPISHWSLSTRLHTAKSTSEAQQLWW